MDNKSILITGSKGQLGKALLDKYPGAQTVDREELDIADKVSVDNFNWDGIKLILNAAAYTNVDGAETDDGRISAWMVNAVAVANLVNIAVKYDMTLVHVSSEYVFNGKQDHHKEDEPLSPLGVYASSKAAGDIAIQLAPKHYLIRTSWVIGEGKNFVRAMLELGSKGVEPSVVNDQIGRLTFTSELVKAIDFLITNNKEYGTYNVSNSGEPTSWADITRTIFEYAGFSLNVRDVSTEEYFKDKLNASPRPLMSTLSLDKIQSLGFELSDWKDDLKAYIKKEQST
jgi:dTDP-4-dehydrorhamnose 3,5-epimerase